MWRKKAGATSFLSLRMKDFIQILIVAGLPLICALLEPPGKCCTLEEYLIRKSKGVAIILPTYYFFSKTSKRFFLEGINQGRSCDIGTFKEISR